MWEDIKNKGLDAEERAYLKDKIIHPHYEVKKHDRADDPYDYTKKPRFGKYKKTDYVEVKGNTANLSDSQKKFQNEHPRSYKVERVDTDNVYHSTKDAGRKIKKFFS